MKGGGSSDDITGHVRDDVIRISIPLQVVA